MLDATFARVGYGGADGRVRCRAAAGLSSRSAPA
jgi:hypothetical protein